MSERVSVSQEKPPTSARPERRQSRRAGVSLPVHIRSVELADGDFQEARTTINASRRSVYFFTPFDRYYRGMRLRVICPYDPKPDGTDLEQDGEVMRVQRLDGRGYAVAVAISGPTSASASISLQKTSAQQARVETERRCTSRSPFVAPVELIDMRTGSRIPARVGDLSLRGCYVDTLNPLPVGSNVRLQIFCAGEAFDVLARVRSSHLGSGMGLVFADPTPAQRTTLRNWLGQRPLPAETAFSPASPRRRRPQVAAGDHLYAVRLIHALVRKGLLTQSEGSALLSDPESVDVCT